MANLYARIVLVEGDEYDEGEWIKMWTETNLMTDDTLRFEARDLDGEHAILTLTAGEAGLVKDALGRWLRDTKGEE